MRLKQRKLREKMKNDKNNTYFSNIEIRELRDKVGISQSKLSELSNIRQYKISSWELGKSKPSKEESSLIFDILKNLNDDDVAKLCCKRTRIDPSRKLNKQNAKDISKINSIINENFPFSNKKTMISWLNYTKKIPIKLMNEIPKKSNENNAISLFSGCGGFCLGFEYEGFNIKGFIEIDKAARDIYKANFPNASCLGNDIRKISDADINNWKKEFGHINVLFGGPPCQGFSLAGKRDRCDLKNELFNEYAKIAVKLKPDVIVLENVQKLTSMKSKKNEMITQLILKVFNDAGYHLKYKPLNAMNFGVPQFRERVFFIGIRKDYPKNAISFPEPTHGSLKNYNLYDFTNKKLRKFNTFRDAVTGLASLESGESSEYDPWHFTIHHPTHVIEWLQDVPEGASAHNNPDPNKRPLSGYNTTYKRIKWDEPCSTITTNFNMISGCRNVHPQDTRSFTIREAMRCQTFPDDFKLPGTRLTDIRRVIGNAVPPLLAQNIAKEVKIILDKVTKSAAL